VEGQAVKPRFTITSGGRWLARDFGDDISRASLCQLEIRADDLYLTKLEDTRARAVRNFANLSAYDLALWLAANWWRLRWEPERTSTDWRMVHTFGAIGHGYIWPDITIISDGERITLATRSTRGAEWEPVRYLENWDFTLNAAEFETGIDAFVEEVLGRLAACQITGADLSELWTELRAERFNPELASLRKLEALAGYDPGEAPDALIDALRTRAASDGPGAINEIAAGFCSEAAAAVDTIDQALAANGVQFLSESLTKLAQTRRSWQAAGAPHERAAEAAHRARELWNLDRAAPIADETLTDIVGADAKLLGEPGDIPIPAARRGVSGRDPWRALLRSRYREGRRFELCRLIADAAQVPEGERLLPATTAKTSRQKFQRTFAQEFLCPVEALIASLGTSHPEDDEIEAAAAHFQVSPLLVRTTLVNNRILPRDQLAV
jgi:hypothetical protein